MDSPGPARRRCCRSCTRARGVTQPGGYHYYDVFDHSIEALAVADGLLSQAEPRGRMARAMRRAFWQTFEPLRPARVLRPDGGRPVAASPDEARHACCTTSPSRRRRASTTTAACASWAIPRPGRRGQPADLPAVAPGQPRDRTSSRSWSRSTCGRRSFRSPARRPSARIFRFFRDLGDAAPACPDAEPGGRRRRYGAAADALALAGAPGLHWLRARSGPTRRPNAVVTRPAQAPFRFRRYTD